MSPQQIDLTGQVFGEWTVLEPAPNKGNNTCWHCRCCCGTESDVRTRGLRSGRSSGCVECSAKAKCVPVLKRRTRLAGIICSAVKRCHSPNNRDYKNYGARGITVCDEWRRDYSAFSRWALANGYRPDLTIDRIDNNAGYCPENCRWATYAEQALNKRNNWHVEYLGKSWVLIDLARAHGINPATMRGRVNRGWSIESAVSVRPLSLAIGEDE